MPVQRLGCAAIDKLAVDFGSIDKLLVVLPEFDGQLVDRTRIIPDQ
jgi:hypothetical protein